MKKEIVGFTAGNFDLIHPGYIYTFEAAKEHCDKFIVFLQRDPHEHRKSKYKPVVPLHERYRTLMAIKYIDEVYVYQTEEELWKARMTMWGLVRILKKLLIYLLLPCLTLCHGLLN